ncbi:DUF1398 family protein [Leptospira jelokensis]|uniref:DUF1398 family protein n=1 Tax=Leptospira jelokensis TaxID=2484931 RepID=UPI001090B015|nr:DUF1398 family protein [Leptospira jelokensis]TGL99702.1 DUF1398 domain-containing protein [Leptospira jelokensis]
MTSLITKLTEAQKYAMSIRPKIGGFPVLAEVLRQAGVTMNRWTLPSCQSVYMMQGGAIVQQGNPLLTGVYEIPVFQKDKLITALRLDQEGGSTFPEFLKSTWEAGVVGYDADFVKRNVRYYGVNGESYQEDYPEVHL